MKISRDLNDDAVLNELGERIAHRRIQQGLTQAALSGQAGVSRSTVDRLERGHSVQLTNLVRVLRELDLLANLDVLLPRAAPTPMELLEREGRRQRAPRRKKADEKWTWGDRE